MTEPASNCEWLRLISPCLRPVSPGERVASHTYAMDAPPSWIEPLRVIYDHELVLFSKGQFRVEVAGREYDCGPDTFIIVPPGRLHASWNAGEVTGRRHWAHFDWAYLGQHGDAPVSTFVPGKPRLELLRPAPTFVPETVFHGAIPNPKRAYELHRELVSLQVEGGEHERLVSRGLFLALLIELLDTPGVAALPADRESFLSHQVRLRLEAAAQDPRGADSIRALLEELGCSYAHLCRLFRRRYGIPPLKYLHALRMARAKLLLRERNARVSEVAYRLGFADLSYFSQLFRKVTGQTPREYAAGVMPGEATEPQRKGGARRRRSRGAGTERVLMASRARAGRQVRPQ
ncbi:MAG: hypothetical protein A3K19_06755 [Lentisphaerae bacterium RIFOXYB12_FULL_65_16]|nr:MAG: hypothetical protein A3K18_22015 [Lentisphaerae bacterium RIFOXYA12_64_32]OGV93150.1 MAG: hypothetical protein A3K19_06755 [Lentisphaerae bacterium RIFOXYB12_FULL_65_16]